MSFSRHFPNLNIHQIQPPILVTKILHLHKQPMISYIRVSFIFPNIMEPLMYFTINIFQTIGTIINVDLTLQQSITFGKVFC